MKFDIWVFFWKSVKIQVLLKSDKVTGTLHEDQYTFFLFLSHSVLLRIIYDSDKIFRENQNTNFVFRNFFYRTVYEIMWKNIVESIPRMTIWWIHIAYYIPNATNTHSQYVIHVAFPLRQWLHEHTLVFRCTHSNLPVLLNFVLSSVSAQHLPMCTCH
jgi:hypothetical protein